MTQAATLHKQVLARFDEIEAACADPGAALSVSSSLVRPDGVQLRFRLEDYVVKGLLRSWRERWGRHGAQCALNGCSQALSVLREVGLELDDNV